MELLPFFYYNHKVAKLNICYEVIIFKERENMAKVAKLGIAGALLLAQGAWALTLKEAMLNTVETNPIIKERLHNYSATREDVVTAKSGWLPKVDYTGTLGHEWGKREFDSNGWQDYTTFENALVLTQNIFNGWSTTHQISMQKARRLAAAYNYIESVHDTGYALVSYYLEVIKNRELLKIANENIRINEEIYNKVKKLYESGLTTKSEMEKAAASLALARSNKVVQENNLKDSLYQFKYYYGIDVKPEKFVVPKPILPIPKSYEEGREFALKNNPTLIVQRYNIKVAQEDYREKRSRYYPKFDIRAGTFWNYNNGGKSFGHVEQRSIMAVVSYNLFNGFSDEAAIQKGISKVRGELAKKEDMSRKTEEGYNLSWSAREYLETKLKALEEYKKHAVNTLRLYSKEYEMGRRSLLDLLSAQNDLINAKSQIVTTQYNLLFAKYRILDAMGLMIPAIVDRTDEYLSKVALAQPNKIEKDSEPVDMVKQNDLFIQALESKRGLDESERSIDIESKD